LPFFKNAVRWAMAFEFYISITFNIAKEFISRVGTVADPLAKF
jgi:hypothetical protein